MLLFNKYLQKKWFVFGGYENIYYFCCIFTDITMNQTTIKDRVVGVDISLDWTSYAIVDVRGQVLVEDRFATEDYPEINGFVTHLAESIVLLVEANGGYETIRSVGISAPSANYLTGCIENSPNMPWKGIIPLSVMLRDQLGMAVAVANNAHVIALGEHAFGCARGMNDFILITLGHGMGSCIYSNGQPHLGVHGFAGEIGHTCINPSGRKCGCGNVGCLEQYTAARGIVLTAQQLMEESDKPSLMREAENLTPELIAQYCDKGDELAIEVYRRTGQFLGFGLAGYASVLNPEAIVFTGGISKAGDWLLKPALESFEEHVFHNIVGKVKFLVSTLNDHYRDILGASVLAWEVKEYSLFK